MSLTLVALLWPTLSQLVLSEKMKQIQVFGKKEGGERERAAPFRMMLSLRFHSFIVYISVLSNDFDSGSQRRFTLDLSCRKINFKNSPLTYFLHFSIPPGF